MILTVRTTGTQLLLRFCPPPPQKASSGRRTRRSRSVFNEDVTPDSVQNGVAVIGVGVDVSYDAASQTAAIHPHNPLPASAALTLSVRRIEDLAGNVMPGILTVNFLCGVNNASSVETSRAALRRHFGVSHFL